MTFDSRPARARPLIRRALAACCLLVASFTMQPVAIGAPAIPETPLVATQAAVPLSMLTVGRDHTLFYEAYNDASDLNGDGVLDIRFKPSITYYGLFDSGVCYTYSDSTGLFSPRAAAGALGKCPSNARWSGNWLNYVTTSRIDALRKVFYGGHREVDTDAETILRRSYIPQDAHSWAKEYTSVANDGYDISEYTPLSRPTSGRRHFFGNLTDTRGINCGTLSNCSDRPPLLRVITNSQDRRVWQWASTEVPVLHETNNHNGTRTDYSVRVLVCTANYNNGCKRYPNGNLKPYGLLHEYGENESMYFGLLTGSYNKNMSGGVLRRVVSSFKAEVDQTTGRFTANATIVNALNSLRIRDFNNGNTSNQYRGGWVTTRAMTEGEFVDWGNPIGEIMYEALRYFAGKKAATSDFQTSGSHDAHLGLPVATWDDPYEAGSAASAQWCARPNMLVVSGINPSFDSDQLPGSAFGSFSGDLTGLNVADIAQTITSHEPNIVGSRYIGQVGNDYDGAPTAKNVTSLGNIRGLAPEEPTKQGSFYSASVAHFGKTTDLRPGLTGQQTVDTYAVVLSSPLPRIEVPVGGRTITVVPFAKSIGGSSISNTKGDFQPTNQIVDFYVDTIANSSDLDRDSTVNGGRYFARFRINFEDVEQGADHDMDAIVVYEVAATANNTLRVRLTPEYQAGGIQHSMGYVISGTTSDGIYLVVQDENVERHYHLNVPPGLNPGACDVNNPPTACRKLPYTNGPLNPTNLRYSERFFSPGASSASLLRDPLWYAAKWGGFVDRNGNNRPDLPLEWDADGDGVPDTYFLVQNPLRLREALKRSFDTIVARSASAGNITSNGQQLQAESRVFQTQFNSANWEGELFSYAITSSGVSTIPTWRASTMIPAATSRSIFTWKDASTKGIPFLWDSLSGAQQTTLGGTAVLNYLRGDQSNEIQQGGTLRTRNRLLGDVVHSSPYFVKDNNTVFVGANDGMLHAFSASTGAEVFAYIPGLVFNKLPTLASPAYAHTFFVDGDIAVSTRSQTPGKNVLVGSTGRGAKGLFALDVTDPASFSAANVLWEYGGAADNDLGHMLGRPQIATLENGTKAVLVGNGHNSVNERAVLYVFNLETGALIKKIDTGVGGGANPNGLSTPALVDSDANGNIDTVYAGDLQGNVWRFDLSNTNDNQWQSHYRSGSTPLPLFTARDPDGNPQPITAQVTVAQNTVTTDLLNYGKTFVFFGTGSYVYASDATSTQVQSWYGLIDEGRITGGRGDLKQRTIDLLGTVGMFQTRVFSEGTNGDMSGKKGWFVDLKDPTARGERIVTSSILYRFLEPVLLVSSIIPDPDPCEAGGGGYVNAINPFTGARLAYSPFDLNNDGRFDDSDKLGGDKVVGSFDPRIGMPGEPTIVGDRLVVGGSSGDIADMRINLGLKRTGRISWREIVRD